MINYFKRIKISHSLLENAEDANSNKQQVPVYTITVSDGSVHKGKEIALVQKSAEIMHSRYGWLGKGKPDRVPPIQTALTLSQGHQHKFDAIKIFKLENLGADMHENLPNIWKFNLIVVWNDTKILGKIIKRAFNNVFINILYIFIGWCLGKYWDSIEIF